MFNLSLGTNVEISDRKFLFFIYYNIGRKWEYVYLINAAGVLITQNRFAKDDNEIHGAGNTAGRRRL
jgi:hypothetical protein